jgi:cell division protease FtsH
MTPGMLGAYLANLVNESALMAARRGRELVGMPEFEEAVQRVIAGLEKKNPLINPQKGEIMAYHQMGHDILVLSLPGTEPVKKISIIPSGVAALGYTVEVPAKNRCLMKKTELENKRATLLRGRAAEEIIFQDISTGAHNDLARATDAARSMVKEYGMSANKIGQVYFARKKRARFLDIMAEGVSKYRSDLATLHQIIALSWRLN